MITVFTGSQLIFRIDDASDDDDDFLMNEFRWRN